MIPLKAAVGFPASRNGHEHVIIHSLPPPLSKYGDDHVSYEEKVGKERGTRDVVGKQRSLTSPRFIASEYHASEQ